MDIFKLEISDKENSNKYVLKDQNIEIGFGYLFNRETNPIEVYINPDFQSNGYGKAFFNALLQEAKRQGFEGMAFELNENQYRIINIISQAGAIQIGKRNSVVKFILKLN